MTRASRPSQPAMPSRGLPGECEWVLAHVSDYIDRELSHDNEQRMDRHLESCRTCLHTTQQIESTSRVLKRWDAERNRGQTPALRIERAVLSRAASVGRVRRRARRQHRLWHMKMVGIALLTIGAGAWFGLRADESNTSSAELHAPHTYAPQTSPALADLHVGPALRARDDLVARRVALSESRRSEGNQSDDGLFGRRAVSTIASLPALVPQTRVAFEPGAHATPPASWKPFRPMEPPTSMLAAIELRRQRTARLSDRLGLDPLHAQWVPVRRLDNGSMVRLDAMMEASLRAEDVHYIPGHAWNRLVRSPSLSSLLVGARRVDPRGAVIPATSLETPSRSSVEAPADGERLDTSIVNFVQDIRPLARWVRALKKGRDESLLSATSKLNGVSLLGGARVSVLPSSTARGSEDASRPRYADPLRLQKQGNLSFQAGSRADQVIAFVSGTTRPTYLAAGQLLSGGATDRMITAPVTLPATDGEQRFAIRCVPVRNGVARPADKTPITLEAAVAGPTLRRLLAERQSSESIQRWVNWYVDIAYRLRRTRAPVLGRSLLDVPGLIRFKSGDKLIPYTTFAKQRERELMQALERQGALGLVMFRRGGDVSRTRQGVIDADSAVPAGMDVLHFAGPYRARLLAQFALSFELESFLHQSAVVLSVRPPESLSTRSIRPLPWREIVQDGLPMYRQLGLLRDAPTTTATISPKAVGTPMTSGARRSPLAGHAMWLSNDEATADVLTLHLFID